MSDDTTNDGTEESAVNPDDEQDDTASSDADQPDDNTDSDSDDEPDVAELKTRLEEAEAEAARYKRRLLASDLRKKQVEKELREARGNSKSEPKADSVDTPKPDDKVERELAALRAEVAATKVRAQFDAINKYQWQNPAAAYRLLDLDDIRQDDGTIDRDDLADAAAALAKANPYLLKTADTPKKGTDRPTGQQPGSHRREQKKDLSTKFSVLRGRV